MRRTVNFHSSMIREQADGLLTQFESKVPTFKEFEEFLSELEKEVGLDAKE